MTAATETLPDPSTQGSALGRTLGEAERAEIIARFHRDGFALVPGVFAEHAPMLRAAADRVFAEQQVGVSDHRYDDIVLTRMFHFDAIFQAMLTAEPLISLADEILGDQCHLVAQNFVRNAPGRAISFFHADDGALMPLPPEVPRYDARMRMPIFLFTFQILLSDVPSDEFGPTQFVPGSHYSGRVPPPGDHPTWEGRGPVSILGRAGDVYLHNGQCWHRGAPNTSDRTRYLLQIAMGQRWVSQRLYPFVDYRIPDHVRARADERCLRVLGVHPKGAYG